MVGCCRRSCVFSLPFIQPVSWLANGYCHESKQQDSVAEGKSHLRAEEEHKVSFYSFFCTEVKNAVVAKSSADPLPRGN